MSLWHRRHYYRKDLLASCERKEADADNAAADAPEELDGGDWGVQPGWDASAVVADDVADDMEEDS